MTTTTQTIIDPKGIIANDTDSQEVAEAKARAIAGAQKYLATDEEHATDYYVTRLYRCRECGHKDPDGVDVELFFEDDAPKGYVHGVWFCPECSEEFYDNIRILPKDKIQRPTR